MRAASLGLTGLYALILMISAAAAETLPGDRTIAFYNIHNKETLSIQYKRGGKYVPEAMQKINWILRDWRRDEPTTMDPKLIDILWEVHEELGSKEPIHIISGYRSPATNSMLRRSVGGQAEKSRHMIGSAADVHFPDVPIQKLRYSALIQEQGGVGYYPTSAIPFVHIDTGRVRAWPRLPKRELALLFPQGETQHRPAEGGTLTHIDVVRARAAGGALVTEIGSFHTQRRAARQTLIAAARRPTETIRGSAQRPTVLAALAPTSEPPPPPPSRQLRSLALEPASPQLKTTPRLAERPQRASPSPLPAQPKLDRSSLFQLAALVALPSSPGRTAAVAPLITPPEFGTDRAPAAQPRVEDVTAVAAPAYDDEHPEELSYRPFPIAPYLTLTASIDDTALAGLIAPDSARTLDLVHEDAESPSLELQPGLSAARELWSGAFDQGRIRPPRPTESRLAATIRP